VSAISPPGGDLTEPVTRHTQRFTPCFWTLDKQLAEARVFPAVSIEQSYSASDDAFAPWWHSHVSPDWGRLRLEALELLAEAARIDRTARLVGEESLPARQRLVLRFAALFEEAFLRQNAYDPVDASASPARQLTLLALLTHCYRRAQAAIDGGLTIEAFQKLPIVAELTRAKSTFGDGDVEGLRALAARIEEQVHP
jgi:V/A-type H+-transporting ATPase subunit A